MEFIAHTAVDDVTAMKLELDKLKKTASVEEKEAMEKNLDGFYKLFCRYNQKKGPSVEWEKVSALSDEAEAIIPYTRLQNQTFEMKTAKKMLDKLVVIKLNGGLGTSMGCKGPKSIISVRNDLTFLDLTVEQIEHLNQKYSCDVPLVLMNSFNTDEDTKNIIPKYSSRVQIFTFNQSWYPEINKETLLPITKDVNDDKSWYPPGHGDIYESFYKSECFEKFRQQGKEYVFISNVDNLGATVDLNILSFLVNSDGVTNREFVMEVTNKTRADVKGGTLIQYEDKLRLLEFAQVPDEYVEDFTSVSMFKVFNTNNLWINLNAIKRNVEEGKLDMEIIVDHKTLENGINVIQLETACGSAIKNFEGAVGVNVPRSRFLPVKKTSDLLLVMSNLYCMVAGSLTMNPLKQFPETPLIKLGTHFDKVQVFLRRFTSIPNMLELDHLTVSGDVTFGKDVILKGTVIIIANHGDRIDIPHHAILENRIVSGNLRILDH
ncbi:UTP--glucose-1-phosphate uridylyltransferase-like [Glandiceps talaboti]